MAFLQCTPLALLALFASREAHDDARAARIRLYAAITHSKIDATIRAVRDLQALSKDPAEAQALATLRAQLDARCKREELRKLTLAYTTGKLDELRAWQTRHRNTQLGRWLQVELAFAFDKDGIQRKDRTRASRAIDSFLSHEATRGAQLHSDLADLLRQSAAQRTKLAFPRSPHRLPTPPPRLAKLLERCETWRLQLSSGTRLRYTLVSQSAVERAKAKCARDEARTRARIKTLERRVRRLKAQIPELTDKERRDARHNNAVIRRDIKRNEAAIADARTRIREYQKRRSALKSLHATTVPGR